MSVTAIGPALDVNGPLPEAAPYNLLSVPGVLRSDDLGGRWQGGIVVDGYPEGVPVAWEPCSVGTFRTKEEGGTVSTPRFDSVGLYQAISCSAMNFGDNWEEWARRAERVLEATLSHGVEMVLAEGADGSSNPFLGDGSVDILGGGTVTPQVGLSWLEDAIAATGRRGMIHADPAVIVPWTPYLQVVNGTLYTYNGTPVAAGSGYRRVAADGNTPASGTSYAFASGPVEVFVSETRLIGDDINGTLDTSNNDVTFRAEKYVIAEWDTALQAAVAIDWTPA